MYVTFIIIIILIIISHFLKFDRYRDTRAYILDPCIQEFLSNFLSTYLQFLKHFSDTLIPVLISWIPASKNFENDIDLDENQGPIERSSQFCDQCQTKELTNFAFDVR